MSSENDNNLKRIANAYAEFLVSRLSRFIDDEPGDCGVSHLTEMCRKLQSPDFSSHKAHRWIGYIQGVMVARGFTTVPEERTNYKTVKSKVLEDNDVAFSLKK